jgi:hypothetical protein
MGTPLTLLQKAERDIEGLRQSIRQMFRDLLTLQLNPYDRGSNQQAHSIATRRFEIRAGEV